MNTKDVKALREQMGTMRAALIDLTQSAHDEVARRARAALFDAGLIKDDQNGGAGECLRLWRQNYMRTLNDWEIGDIARNSDHPLYDEAVAERWYRTTGTLTVEEARP